MSKPIYVSQLDLAYVQTFRDLTKEIAETELVPARYGTYWIGLVHALRDRMLEVTEDYCNAPRERTSSKYVRLASDWHIGAVTRYYLKVNKEYSHVVGQEVRQFMIDDGHASWATQLNVIQYCYAFEESESDNWREKMRLMAI